MQIRHMAPCALTTMTMLMMIKIVGDYAENNTVGDGSRLDVAYAS